MVSECPRCGEAVTEDLVYCPYCGRGLKPRAKSFQVSFAGALLIVVTVASLIFLVLAIQALSGIYSWYPPLVAQSWFVYDQAFSVLVFAGFLFGLLAAGFSLARKNYVWTMIFSALCACSACGALTISLIIPHSSIAASFLYYFMPLLLPSVVATILIFPKRAEFKS
jgi:RNA polymerase subunit RPABC4/transcription elongation factor Spt4